MKIMKLWNFAFASGSTEVIRNLILGNMLITFSYSLRFSRCISYKS